jgi:hypothetical protein
MALSHLQSHSADLLNSLISEDQAYLEEKRLLRAKEGESLYATYLELEAYERSLRQKNEALKALLAAGDVRGPLRDKQS